MKKIVSLLLVLAMIFSMTQAFASYYDYNVGPITYDMEGKYITYKNGATTNGNQVTFSGAGSVIYDFYLPFNTVSADVSYTAQADTSLTITTDEGKEIEATLTASADTINIPFDITERKGERVFTISADGACVITKITLNKEKIKTTSYNKIYCNLTKEEEAIQSTVLMDTKASIIMVNGSRRYINNDNPKEIPENFKGSIYLPAHSLARAFGMYLEDMPERDYILLRSDDKEFVFYRTAAYQEEYNVETSNINNVVLYKDGKAYLPVRFFGEALGKTVGYRDGIIAIDDKFTVSKILNDDTMLNYVRNQFKPFYPDETTGKEIYVAQTSNASDSNPGTSGSPYKTLAKAAAVAQAGDTVIVGEGVYKEVLSPQNNGTATKPIVFKAENENTVISATKTVSGFVFDRKTSGGLDIYKAPLPQGFVSLGDGRNQVFYNNESLIEARYPNGPAIEMGDKNEPLSKLWPAKGDFKTEKGNIYKVVSDTLLKDGTDWTGATLVIMREYGYTLNMAKVASSHDGYLMLDSNSTSKYYWDADRQDIWTYGYLSGHRAALDTYDEWFIEDGYLYIIPPQGVSGNGLSVEIKSNQLVADLENSKFVKLEGFSTIGGSIKMNNSEMCTLDGMNMKYLNHYTWSKDQHTGFIDTNPADYSDITKDPKGAPSRGEVGIYLGGRDNTIINNTFDHAAAAAIYGVGYYAYIENNLIKDCGYMGSYVAGLYFTGEKWKDNNKTAKRGGHFIYHNTVYNTGRSAMQHTRPAGGDMWPYLPEDIAYNDFHDAMLTSLDTGVTYEYEVMMGNEKLFTKMHHNLVYTTTEQTNPYSMGIYHDGSAENIDTYSNIVFSIDPNKGFTHNMVYTQTAVHKNDAGTITRSSIAYCPNWNNVKIQGGISDIDQLEAKDYPHQKPFYAGAFTDEEYLVNFNNISGAKTYSSGIFKASDSNVELHGTTLDENGAALLDQAGEYVKFANVDFGEEKVYKLAIEYYQDKYNVAKEAGDTVEIIIGDDIETGKKYTKTILTNAERKDVIDIYETPISYVRGEQTVYIKAVNSKSIRIAGIKACDGELVPEPLYAERVYGGFFSYYEDENTAAPPKRSYNTPDGSLNPIVNSTYNGTTIVYEDVTFSEDVTKFKASICYPADPAKYNLKMEIRIDSKTAQPVGVVNILHTTLTEDITQWFTYSDNVIDISKITAGKHTVYLTFKGTYTSNLHWFEFYN